MTYGKLSNNKIYLVPSQIKYHDSMFLNPTEEILKAEGYKPVILVTPPAVPTGYHLVESWTETTNVITQVWTTAANSLSSTS